MSVLKNYQAASTELKTEVVRINNFLSDWCEDPNYEFCDVELDELYLDTTTGELVVCTCGWEQSWGIPEIYLSMSDDDILAHAKSDYYARYKAAEDNQVERIRNDALLYGYKLVKVTEQSEVFNEVEVMSALNNLAIAYRTVVGLDGAYDDCLVKAETLLKKWGV